MIKPFDINFDEQNHRYVTNDGEWYPGVTTICSLLAKGALVPWAALETVKALGYRGDAAGVKAKIAEMTLSEYEALLETAKTAHKTKSNKALDSGALAHDIVEERIKSWIKGEEHIVRSSSNLEVVNAVKAFMAWTKEHEITWHDSEVVVGSREHKFAGTMDALATIDGELTLVDFKTSKDIYPENFLQTAAYQICLEEQGVVPERRMVIRLPKDGKPVSVQVDTIPYDLCARTFLHLRGVQSYQSYLNEMGQKYEKVS